MAAVALVGSWARGNPTAGSDVDVVILTREPALYLNEDGWASPLGVERFVREQSWGALTERRALTSSGLEVEFGITTPAWADVEPVDAGTQQVVRSGLRVLYDPDGLLARLVRAAG